MLTLKENQSYAITMRFLKNRLNFMFMNVEQEVIALNLAYAHSWFSPIRELTNSTMNDLSACSDALLAGQIPVSYVINYIDNAKVSLDNALVKFARRLLNKQESLKRNPEKFEPLVLSIVEFQKYDPKAIMESNLQGRQEKLEQLSQGIPTYPQIASVLRIEELQQQNLVNRIVKSLSRKAEVASETEVGFDFHKEYHIQGNDTLEYAQKFVLVRLDSHNPNNNHFVKSTMPKTNAKFMQKQEHKISDLVKEVI